MFLSLLLFFVGFSVLHSFLQFLCLLFYYCSAVFLLFLSVYSVVCLVIRLLQLVLIGFVVLVALMFSLSWCCDYESYVSCFRCLDRFVVSDFSVVSVVSTVSVFFSRVPAINSYFVFN